MYDFGKKKNKKLLAGIIIVVVAAMLLTTVLAAFYSFFYQNRTFRSTAFPFPPCIPREPFTLYHKKG